MSAMDAYREFTGKSVEDALRQAREEFGVGLDDLDFEILTPGSRGVLGMGAEPARLLAAPRSALGGAAPKRDAAASKPLPPPPPRDRERDDRGFGRREGGFGDRDRDRGPRREGGFGDRDRDRGPRREGGFGGDRDRAPQREGSFGGDRDRGRDRGFDRDRPPRREVPSESYGGTQMAPPAEAAISSGSPAAGTEAPPREGREGREWPEGPGQGRGEGRGDRPRRYDDRGPRRDGPRREAPREQGQSQALSEREEAEVNAARGSVAAERAELEAAEASPEALAAGKVILDQLLEHMGFDVRVEVESGETSRLNVVGDGEEREALGALIGRKGERLSALQHLVNLMLSREMGAWTRVLVDVEDYRGRRERQLREIAERAARRVVETGKMLQLEPMPALERRWVHLALRNNGDVATQSIGEEPNRRIVVVPRA
jgi:spoIIIJ-associated protein